MNSSIPIPQAATFLPGSEIAGVCNAEVRQVCHVAGDANAPEVQVKLGDGTSARTDREKLTVLNREERRNRLEQLAADPINSETDGLPLTDPERSATALAALAQAYGLRGTSDMENAETETLINDIVQYEFEVFPREQAE